MLAAALGRFAVLGSVPVCYGIGVLTLAQMHAAAFAAGVQSGVNAGVRGHMSSRAVAGHEIRCVPKGVSGE